MKFVVQRVKSAKVAVHGKTAGEIGHGLMVLCGMAEGDTKEIADKMVRKLCNLRIFEDGNGKTNLSLSDVGGELMIISQFTLCADCRRGNRPSFVSALGPDMALPLYEHILSDANKYVNEVKHGVFGAEMVIDLKNDGPFTVILDSDILFGRRVG